MHYELADYEWAAIRPMLPNKPRGAPRVNDRRILNGIFWVLRSGAPWRDLPDAFGPQTTCYNRFGRWRWAGVWNRIIGALATAHDAAVQMIDTSIVRVHQHGACIRRNQRQSMGRSRGGLTSKIHGVCASQPAADAPSTTLCASPHRDDFVNLRPIKGALDAQHRSPSSGPRIGHSIINFLGSRNQHFATQEANRLVLFAAWAKWSL